MENQIFCMLWDVTGAEANTGNAKCFSVAFMAPSGGWMSFWGLRRGLRGLDGGKGGEQDGRKGGLAG